MSALPTKQSIVEEKKTFPIEKTDRVRRNRGPRDADKLFPAALEKRKSLKGFLPLGTSEAKLQDA